MRLKDQTEIKEAVRERVYERDSYGWWPCCIYCGSSSAIEIHHYVERSRGGMGIEENLVCLCPRCHQRLHSGEKEIKIFCESYLSEHYEGWSEDKLIFRK